MYRPASKTSARYWEHRIYQASYRRNGKTRHVKNWSIKIQHQGIRRSIPLATTSRGMATKRAAQIYQAISSGGWSAADELLNQLPRPLSSPRQPSLGHPDGTHTQSYWKPRLSRRNYLDHAGLPSSEQWSVKIERAGLNDYFPTQSKTIDSAVTFGNQLLQVIENEGWHSACRRFSREFTMAIFWSVAPLSCTYSTMLTLVEKELPRRRRWEAKARTVAVIEPREEIRNTIAYWLTQNRGFRVSVLETPEEAQEHLKNNRCDLVLLNRQSFDLTTLTRTRLGTSNRPPPAILGYGLYEDSNQIFRSVTGVNRGYYLRRRPPSALLEPIAFPANKTALATTIPSTVKTYFQHLFTEMAHAPLPSNLNLLTRRELEILEHLAAGYLDKEIAHRLRISNWTVRNHLKRIYRKLGIHNRTEAVIQYLQK